MDQNQNPGTGSNLFQLNLDAHNSYTLRSAASWAKVLGVVSIILGILFAITGILLQQNAESGELGSSYRRAGINASSVGNLGLAVNVVIALIFVMSGMFAMNAGNKISVGLKTNNMEKLNGGFAGARNFFALWAILIILCLILVLLGMLGSMGS